MPDEKDMSLREFYRRIARFYLRMAKRTQSPEIRGHNLQQAAEWREKALGGEAQANAQGKTRGLAKGGIGTDESGG